MRVGCLVNHPDLLVLGSCCPNSVVQVLHRNWGHRSRIRCLGRDQRSSVRIGAFTRYSAAHLSPRFAMTDYGKRSPIGSTLSAILGEVTCAKRNFISPARQEKLLQGLMTEIVRMTSQQQPLEVGIPLYPFSHAGVFSKQAPGNDKDGGHILVAPLPPSPSYEETVSPSHSSPAQSNMSPPATAGLAWVSR
jgi:hypothetical protein